MGKKKGEKGESGIDVRELEGMTRVRKSNESRENGGRRRKGGKVEKGGGGGGGKCRVKEIENWR